MIGLTGATGGLGGRVLERLLEGEAEVRCLVRDPARLRAEPASVVTVEGLGALGPGLDGVDVLLLVSGEEAPDRVAQHLAAVDAAAAAGVRHVVYTSFMGAAEDAVFHLARDHWRTEEAIRASGMAFTFLRNCLYQDVLPGFASGGVVRGPAGDGRGAFVARADCADAAAAVLAAPDGHAGATYTLTGPEALTLDEVCSAIGARFVDETLEEAGASRGGSADEWMVEAWISTYTAIAQGEMAEVTDAVERLTGRPPRALAETLAP